ncbi:MAG: SURF1 family protein [Gammaproteobacteria bacterium]
MNIGSYLNIPLFTISLGKLEFKPGLFPTLVTLVFLYLLISLGQWQLDRAEYKTNIENLVKERKDLPPIVLNMAPAGIDERMYLPVKTHGTFDSNHQIFLDNRVVKHQAGYDVYTPLLRENAPALLVKRGWVKMGRTRQNLPDINIDNVYTDIAGILNKPPSHGLILSDNANQYQQWPALAQFIDLDEIESILGYPLYPMILVLDGQHESALHQQPIAMNMNSAKHHGYAFQWFALATTLTIIYLVVNTKRGNRKNDRAS